MLAVGGNSQQSVELVLIIALLLAAAVLGVFALSKPRRWRSRTPFDQQRPDLTDVGQQLHAVMAGSFERRRVLSPSEYRVFAIVENEISVLRLGYRVFAQTSLGEILRSSNHPMASVLHRAGYAAAIVAAAIAGFSVLAMVIAPTNAASVFFAVCALGLGVLAYVLWPRWEPSTIEPEVSQTLQAPDGQRRRRRVIVHNPRRGFFGWLFLLIFLAFNGVMAFALVGFLIEIGKMTDDAEGLAIAAGQLILFFWACGAVITGLLALVMHGRGQRTVIEEEIER
jgi:hypothetical protein